MKKNPEKAQELMEAAAAAKPTLTIKRMIRQLHVSFCILFHRSLFQFQLSNSLSHFR